MHLRSPSSAAAPRSIMENGWPLGSNGGNDERMPSIVGGDWWSSREWTGVECNVAEWGEEGRSKGENGR